MTHTKDEALKLAIQSLESCSGVPHWPAICATIVTIKQALAAQQEHEPENEPYVSLASVQPVAHCEAGPEYCQQCHLEDRSLALAAAVRYVKNNTPKLVSDEICMALTTPPAAHDLQAELDATNRQVEILSDALAESQRQRQSAQRQWVGLTHDEYDAICDKHSAMSDFDFLEDIEAKLKEKNT